MTKYCELTDRKCYIILYYVYMYRTHRRTRALVHVFDFWFKLKRITAFGITLYNHSISADSRGGQRPPYIFCS